MEKITDKRRLSRIIILFAATYMVSYITRINFGAVIAAMVEDTGFGKPLLSLAVTGSFITYGSGQIISGILGDRFPPKKLILYGLTVTTAMNLLMLLCNSPYHMLVVWCINGFAQAFMWPPLIKLMIALFPAEDYKSACVRVSWGSTIGTIAVYLASPAVIALSGWRTVFLFSALCGAVMIFIWNRLCPDIAVEKRRSENKSGAGSIILTPLVLCIMLAIILQGILRDGVTTWMPSYISESYALSSEISIITGVFMPILSILCIYIAGWIYRKKIKNPVSCAAVIFGVGASASGLLFLHTGGNAATSVFLAAAITGSMHGVNLMLITMLPPYFEKYGNVSTVSGVLNACVYIGSAISTYGIAVLSEGQGWHFTLFTWFITAAAGTAICVLCSRPWRKKMM